MRISGIVVVMVFALRTTLIAADIAGGTVLPGTDLQAILDRGEDLQLEPGKVYDIKKTLFFRNPGQTVSTSGATNLASYAVLRIAAADCFQLINGNRMTNIVLERVLLDGNRYVLGCGQTRGGTPPLAQFGEDNARGQVIRHCVFTSPRSWSTLKVHEGGEDILVDSNIFLDAADDARGNGREARDLSNSWGDGISCAGRRVHIVNNLIMDATDAGIVLYGSPGSLVEENVIAAISRESLGAINMVDPLGYYAMDEGTNHVRTDYRGLVVRNNWIDVRGARIHIAMPMGGAPWAPKNKDCRLVGATVTGNTITGGAAAYGFIAYGVEDFVVTNNTSTATYSGIGEGLNPKTPPDDPGPFLYTPASVSNCVLQSEFQPSKRHLMHLLRCNHGKTNALGYRVYAYGDAEAEAVVQTAYLEMLGREPTEGELQHRVSWLQATKGTADQLRCALLMTPEFTDRHGFVSPDELHLYRQRLWLAMLDQVRSDLAMSNNRTPSAKQLYAEALKRLKR